MIFHDKLSLILSAIDIKLSTIELYHRTHLLYVTLTCLHYRTFVEKDIIQLCELEGAIDRTYSIMIRYR